MAWALQFDGVNDHLTRATPDSYNGNLTNYRWVARAIRDSSSNLYFIGRAGSFNDYISQQSSVFRIRYGSSTVSWNATVPVSTNEVEWTVTRNGNTHELFIDGVSQGTVSSSGTSSAVKGYIGRANNSNTAAIKLIKMQLWDANVGGSLLSNYDATNSSHAAGTAVLTDTVGGNNGTGVNMPTDGSAWVDLGGGGISIEVTESGPSFTESINTNLSVNITGAIVENGPAFTDAVNVTLTSLTLQANIAESGPSFTESIAATLTETLTINTDIVEQGPSFTESITASLGVNITSVITESGPSFTESINISVIGDRVASIVENGPSFTESIIASIPITITVNPKNIIRMKRKDNTVIIKRKSNIIRVR